MSESSSQRAHGGDALRLEDLIAEAVERRLAPYLDQIAALARNAGTGREKSNSESLTDGIHPDRLYSVPFLKDRWGVGSEFFYRLDEDLLPRASWPGREIRYRGMDILKAEGIDTHATPVHPTKAKQKTTSSNRPPKRSSRPYTKDLPEL